MRIVALVPAADAGELKSLVCRASDAFAAVHSAAVLRSLVDRGDCALVIVDPMVVRDGVFDDVLVAVRTAGLPLVLWTALSAVSATRVVRAAAQMPVEVLLRSVDREYEWGFAIRRLAPASTAASLALHGLAHHIACLPDLIAPACVGLWSGVRGPEAADAFASQTRLERRTVERALVRAGFRGVKPLLDAARLARTWVPLSDHTKSLNEVAIHGGWSSVKTLERQFNAQVGMSARAAARSLSTLAFAELLVGAVLQ